MTTWHVEHCADSFARLREMHECAYDVALTDPPYTAHVQANMMSGTTFKRYVDGEIDRRGGVPKVSMPFSPLTDHAVASDLVRVSRRWALMFCAVESFGALSAQLGKDYVRGGIWYKPNSMGQLTGDRPAAAYEGVAVMHGKNAKKRWNGRGSYGIWKCNGTRGEKGRHPNQKPLDLCLKLVALFSERGETIFDPFCGSGRIGEAALLLGRGYVGWDSDHVWVAKSREKLAAVPIGALTDAHALGLCAMKG